MITQAFLCLPVFLQCSSPPCLCQHICFYYPACQNTTRFLPFHSSQRRLIVRNYLRHWLSKLIPQHSLSYTIPIHTPFLSRFVLFLRSFKTFFPVKSIMHNNFRSAKFFYHNLFMMLVLLQKYKYVQGTSKN